MVKFLSPESHSDISDSVFCIAAAICFWFMPIECMASAIFAATSILFRVRAILDGDISESSSESSPVDFLFFAGFIFILLFISAKFGINSDITKLL